MEDTLRVYHFNAFAPNCGVLILVVMEDTLRDFQDVEDASFLFVLILVVMEDILRVTTNQPLELLLKSLNPCCNGRYSPRAKFTYRYISTC